MGPGTPETGRKESDHQRCDLGWVPREEKGRGSLVENAIKARRLEPRREGDNGVRKRNRESGGGRAGG